MNPCIKTGATVTAPGCWWHGDLFDLGDYLVLNCNAGRQENDAATCANLSIRNWYTTFQDDKVVIISKHDVDWFDYKGRLI